MWDDGFGGFGEVEHEPAAAQVQSGPLVWKANLRTEPAWRKVVETSTAVGDVDVADAWAVLGKDSAQGQAEIRAVSGGVRVAGDDQRPHVGGQGGEHPVRSLRRARCPAVIRPSPDHING